MINKIKVWFNMMLDYRVMMKGSKFFEKNPVVQGRFEENEEWLEELEDRVVTLEEDSHPAKDLCEFDSWEVITQRFKNIEEKLGIEYQNEDN